MHWSTLTPWLAFLPLACGKTEPTPPLDEPDAPAETASVGDTGPGPTSTTDTGGPRPCEGLADAVRIASVPISGAVSGRAVTAQAGSGSFVAWVGADGVHATPLDAEDRRSGDDVVVPGTQIFGAAATATDVSLLVSRAPDFMTFTRSAPDGRVLVSTDLVGGGDHDQEGVEWFGEFATTGRLVALGDGTYAAYHALHRRWPDGIGHQGDALRLLDAAGSTLGGWDWGCSHSMDQRLVAGPAGPTAICIADCYPDKGIWLDHDRALLTPDPAANCAGGHTTSLGGLVAQAAGFALVYGDAAGQAHLGRFDPAGQPVGDRILGEPATSRLAAYDDGLLLGSDAGGQASLQRLDAEGAPVGTPLPLAVALPELDFESRSGGDVAWATATATDLTVVRVHVCR